MYNNFLEWAENWIVEYRESQERWCPDLKWDYDRVYELAEQIAAARLGVAIAWLELDQIRNPYAYVLADGYEGIRAYRSSRSGIAMRTDNLLEEFLEEAIDRMRTVNQGHWRAHWTH